MIKVRRRSSQFFRASVLCGLGIAYLGLIASLCLVLAVQFAPSSAKASLTAWGKDISAFAMGAGVSALTGSGVGATLAIRSRQGGPSDA